MLYYNILYYIILSEVGEFSPTGKSFRFVRACERSCVCPRDDDALNAGRLKLATSSVPVPVPVPLQMLDDVKSCYIVLDR